MKRSGIAAILMMVAFAVELVLAQGSCCQPGSSHKGMNMNMDMKSSGSDPNSSEISFPTLNGGNYNLAKVVGSEPILVYRMKIDKDFDAQATLVNKTRTATPESSIIFISVISDNSSQALSKINKLKLNFPVLIDSDNQLIAKFGLAEKSPVLIFLNQDGEVVKTASDVNQEVLAQGIAAATAPAQTVDPVCGMAVNKGTAGATLEYQGKTYYFCSDACKKLFEETPAKYLNK